MGVKDREFTTVSPSPYSPPARGGEFIYSCRSNKKILDDERGVIVISQK